jgi:ABC-type glutathione transport system ATPase component
VSDQGTNNLIDIRESPGDDVVLSVRELSKCFPVRRGAFQRVGTAEVALDRVSFDVRRGTTLAVVGESGGGKTTLCRCVAGLERPTAGGVYLRSRRAITRAQATGGTAGQVPAHLLDRADARRFHRCCQLVTQYSATSLNPKRNVHDLIARALKAHGRTSEGPVEEQVVAALERVGLGRDILRRFPNSFSIGQLQRIAIARALALDPEVLVLDEPTASVDLSAQAHVLNLLVDLQRAGGLSYLLVTHDLSVALHMADDVVVLRTGQVVESGPIESVLRSPSHPYTRHLVEADPELQPGR